MLDHAVDEVATGEIEVFLGTQQIQQGSAPECKLLAHRVKRQGGDLHCLLARGYTGIAVSGIRHGLADSPLQLAPEAIQFETRFHRFLFGLTPARGFGSSAIEVVPNDDACRLVHPGDADAANVAPGGADLEVQTGQHCGGGGLGVKTGSLALRQSFGIECIPKHQSLHIPEPR